MMPTTVMASNDAITVSVVCCMLYVDIWKLFVGDSDDINLNSIFHDPSEYNFEVIL